MLCHFAFSLQLFIWHTPHTFLAGWDGSLVALKAALFSTFCACHLRNLWPLVVRFKLPETLGNSCKHNNNFLLNLLMLLNFCHVKLSWIYLRPWEGELSWEERKKRAIIKKLTTSKKMKWRILCHCFFSCQLSAAFINFKFYISLSFSVIFW